MFVLHDGVEVGFGFHAVFNCAREAFEAAESLKLLLSEIHSVANAPGPDMLSPIERAPQKIHGFVVRFQRHGKWMPVFATMRERKARRIVKARRRAVNEFGNQGERLKGPRSELFQQ